MLHWYDTVFSSVAQVFVYPPATQGITTHEQTTLEEILARIRASGVNAVATDSLEKTTALLSKTLTQNDVVLILTSGHMGGLVRNIPLWLDATYGTERLS